MTLPYLESIRWSKRRLGYVVPHLTAWYDRCNIDDEAFKNGTPQRPEAVHVHKCSIEIIWLGFVAHVVFPASGPPRRGWRWPK